MKRNTVILISIIVIITAFVFWYFNKTKKVETEGNATGTPEFIEPRPAFNTNVDKNIPVQEILPESESTEITKVNSIKKLLSNWQITKNGQNLKDAVNLSGGSDNEAFYDPWVSFFVNGNSKELIAIINTSTDRKGTTKKVFYIFEWFINGSGEYEKLSAGKRQEISNQYAQLKTSLGIK